jgi:hypothetical protein
MLSLSRLFVLLATRSGPGGAVAATGGGTEPEEEGLRSLHRAQGSGCDCVYYPRQGGAPFRRRVGLATCVRPRAPVCGLHGCQGARLCAASPWPAHGHGVDPSHLP